MVRQYLTSRDMTWVAKLNSASVASQKISFSSSEREAGPRTSAHFGWRRQWGGRATAGAAS